MPYEEVELTRDCEAIQIPHGTSVTLHKGTPAVITQALGGTYTIQVPTIGGLFRIADQDADALGKQSQGGHSAAVPTDGTVTEDDVWEQLRQVYDPEIPVNIVDLGLVYDMRIEPQPNGHSRVQVVMTVTAPGCGMGPSIAMDAQHRLQALPGVEEADVQLVWDPPWGPQMISPAGREKLGM